MGSTFQTASDALSRRCAEELAALARARGVPASLSGGSVALPGSLLSMRARVEARQAGDGRMVVSVAVEASIDGQPGFVVGSVGVGNDEAGAIETAIEEWGALVGPALVGASVPAERTTERYAVGGYVAYPGATGFRGPMPPLWASADHQRLLNALARALPPPADDRQRAVTLTVMVEAGQMPQGEVRLDGIVAASLWAVAQMFAWPTSAAGYIFKQFYLLAPMGS